MDQHFITTMVSEPHPHNSSTREYVQAQSKDQKDLRPRESAEAATQLQSITT